MFYQTFEIGFSMFLFFHIISPPFNMSYINTNCFVRVAFPIMSQSSQSSSFKFGSVGLETHSMVGAREGMIENIRKSKDHGSEDT